MITARQLRAVAPLLTDVAGWTGLLNEVLPGFGIVEPADQCAFLGQSSHESLAFTRLEENLNYRADKLQGEFPDRITAAQALLFGRTSDHAADPQSIANTVYGGAWGKKHLGNTQPNDGWYFRGRGLIQLTGRSNYTAAARRLGIGIVQLVEYAGTRRGAIEVSADFWRDKGCTALALAGNELALCRRINGGTKGLVQRRQLMAAARQAMLPAAA